MDVQGVLRRAGQLEALFDPSRVGALSRRSLEEVRQSKARLETLLAEGAGEDSVRSEGARLHGLVEATLRNLRDDAGESDADGTRT